jgi:hypothetical protein
MNRAELLRRADKLRSEIASVDEVIAEIDSASIDGASKTTQLTILRSLRSLRERELQEVAIQLGPG